MRFLCTAAFVAFSLAGQSADAATSITFTETEFGAGTFTSEKVPGYASGNQSTAQSASGNPGNALQVVTTDNGNIYFAHFLTGAVLTSADQQVTSFDFSIDVQWANGLGAGMAYGMVIEQDGDYFLDEVFPVTGSGNSTWQTFSFSGFTAADFRDMDQFSSSTEFGDPVDTLDFSLGSDMRLGFYTANSRSIGRAARYDNVSITANGVAVQAAVPLPAGLPLLLAGLGGLAMLRRRTRCAA